MERVSLATKQSALLICGFAHTFSVSERFQAAGFDVEVRIFLDAKDDQTIRERKEIGPEEDQATLLSRIVK